EYVSFDQHARTPSAPAARSAKAVPPLPPVAAASTKPGALGRSATPPPPPARLLLVDDDPLIVNSLSEFLRLEGYAVDVAPDGAQAVEMLATTRYSLVITDVNMPRTNG